MIHFPVILPRKTSIKSNKNLQNTQKYHKIDTFLPSKTFIKSIKKNPNIPRSPKPRAALAASSG